MAVTFVLFVLVLIAVPLACAQSPSGVPDPATTVPAQTPAQLPDPHAAQPGSSPQAPLVPKHKFWDGENILLFSGVGAARFLDFASTLNLRARGLDEIFLNNEIVDNHPLFAGIEAGGTALSIGASYLFHRTGHHRLERWTSYVHIGLTVGGAARNYALKTAPH